MGYFPILLKTLPTGRIYLFPAFLFLRKIGKFSLNFDSLGDPYARLYRRRLKAF
jgi:hypothetical protein